MIVMVVVLEVNVVLMEQLVLRDVQVRVVLVGVRSWLAAPVMMDTPMRDLSVSWTSLQASFPPCCGPTSFCSSARSRSLKGTWESKVFSF